MNFFTKPCELAPGPPGGLAAHHVGCPSPLCPRLSLSPAQKTVEGHTSSSRSWPADAPQMAPADQEAMDFIRSPTPDWHMGPKRDTLTPLPLPLTICSLSHSGDPGGLTILSRLICMVSRLASFTAPWLRRCFTVSFSSRSLPEQRHKHALTKVPCPL